jgi:hypothetical protein
MAAASRKNCIAGKHQQHNVCISTSLPFTHATAASIHAEPAKYSFRSWLEVTQTVLQDRRCMLMTFTDVAHLLLWHTSNIILGSLPAAMKQVSSLHRAQHCGGL